MDDVKELIKDLKRINEKAAKMSQSYWDLDPMTCFDIEFSRSYMEDTISHLERGLARIVRKRKAA